MNRTAILTIFFLFLFAIAFCQNTGLELRIFKIKYSSSESLYETLNSLKSEEGRVSFDNNTNSIIVVDYPQNMERISSVIDMLDIRQKQVEIKVMVIESTSESLEQLGISSARAVIPSEAFSAIVNLVKTNKNTEIRTQMSVLTLSNQPARFQDTTDEVIGNEVVVTDNGTEIIQPVREKIGASLEVLPRINDDNTITVILRPAVSALEKEGAPSESAIFTRAVIADGDTLVLGGADTSKEGAQEEETLLAIPFFKKSVTEGRKVVMFLTANIVD